MEEKSFERSSYCCCDDLLFVTINTHLSSSILNRPSFYTQAKGHLSCVCPRINNKKSNKNKNTPSRFSPSLLFSSFPPFPLSVYAQSYVNDDAVKVEKISKVNTSFVCIKLFKTKTIN